MTFKKLLLGTALISCLSISPALAGKDPRPTSADARVKVVTYHENDVYQIRGHYGYSTVIEFSEKERIQTISLGDTATCIWNDAYPQVEPASYEPEPIAELKEVKEIEVASVPVPSQKPDIAALQAEKEEKPSLLAQLFSNFDSPKTASLNE